MVRKLGQTVADHEGCTLVTRGHAVDDKGDQQAKGGNEMREKGKTNDG